MSDWRDKFRRLNPEQRKFVIARLTLTSDAKAARSIGVPVSTVRDYPQQVHDVIREALEEELNTSLEILRAALPKAAAIKVSGLDADKRTRQSVATEILERFHGKPKQQTEITGLEGPIHIVLTWGDSDNDNPTGPA